MRHYYDKFFYVKAIKSLPEHGIIENDTFLVVGEISESSYTIAKIKSKAPKKFWVGSIKEKSCPPNLIKEYNFRFIAKRYLIPMENYKQSNLYKIW